MPIDFKEFELNRITNLLKSMGWSIVSSGFEGEKVVVVFEKTVPTLTTDLKKIEGDRITTMLKSYDWVSVKSEYPPNRILLQYEKVVKGEAG